VIARLLKHAVAAEDETAASPQEAAGLSDAVVLFCRVRLASCRA
jgi:hypothetical protein